MSDDEVQDFLSGGGAPSLSFPTIGTTYKGEILQAQVTNQTDIDGNEKLFDSGQPRKQLVVTLQTDLFDPEIPNDDGQRRVFIKGQMVKALKTTLRKQGVLTVENGGWLTVAYTADEPASRRGYNPTKLYEVEYEAPTGAVVDTASAQTFLQNEEPF